jgi:hypothetical protein
MMPSPIPEDLRAVKRRLERDIATPGLSLLLALTTIPLAVSLVRPSTPWAPTRAMR